MNTPRKRTATRHATAATPGARMSGTPDAGARKSAALDTDGRKSVAPDASARERNLLRLRRIEGQVRGLQRMVENDRYCADVLTQIASVHEALRAVGRELMRHHLKHCATSAIRTGGPDGEAMYDELMELMYRTVR
jgi:DNA-binding FrmR family transcriptional regulator